MVDSARDTQENPTAAVKTPIGQRVNAVKKLHLKWQALSARFESEALKIFVKEFAPGFQDIDLKRRAIICGKDEPTAEECIHGFEGPYDDEEVYETSVYQSGKGPAPTPGVPNFWLQAMMNCGAFDGYITRKDDALLSHLTDITSEHKNLTDSSYQLVLKCHFAPNEYMSDEVLTKEFDVKFGVDPQNPWSALPFYPTDRRSSGIHWKKGVKTSNRDESFFGLFLPLDKPKLAKDIEEWERVMAEEWELSLFIAKKFIPNAVLYYTGEMAEDDGEETDSSYPSSSVETDDDE